MIDMKKALHIDDSYTVHQIVSSTAATLDIEMLYASNGPKGLETAKEFCEEISLIILDFNMPGPNGLEVLKALKADDDTKHIPVMMLTSDGRSDLVMDCIKAGAVNYLNKPFQQEDLLTRIMSCVGEAAW